MSDDSEKGELHALFSVYAPLKVVALARRGISTLTGPQCFIFNLVLPIKMATRSIINVELEIMLEKWSRILDLHLMVI